MKWSYFLLLIIPVAACTESRSTKTGGSNVETNNPAPVTQIEVPTWYYAHFGADYSLETPAEGFGGWNKTDLPFCPEHTALCVMHAWDNPDQNLFPGIYSAVEYLPRAAEIFKTRMPSILKTFRDAGIRVIHIESGKYVQKYDAYRQTQDIIREQLSEARKARQFAMPGPAHDPVFDALRKFRGEYAHPGEENKKDIRGVEQIRDIHECVKPLPGEYMVEDSDELQAVCALHEINHLVYVGFALNACLLISPCGMVDMSRRGFICSTVKEVTTAVENDFSAKDELAKQLGLWYTALFFGFVYEQADLENALR
jgi:nicotinamidase-related amidase